MALVSPGLQITVTDESQYVPGAVGTVPLVIVATAQDKTINGSVATGTTKANAGALQAFGSQRELATAMGYPIFKQSASGTALHGNELNEYGLMATYSAIGLGNRVYAIRADIDLAQLEASNRPVGAVANGTYWLDITNSQYGISEWNATTGTFVSKTPIVISDAADAIEGQPYTPADNIGSIGDYAIVTLEDAKYGFSNFVWYKNNDNVWVKVGSADWQRSFATVTGSVVNPVLDAGTNEIDINGETVDVGDGDDLATIISNINDANITGVTAGQDSTGRLQLFVDSSAQGRYPTSSTADGRLSIINTDSLGNNDVLDTLGITAGAYTSPTVDTRYACPELYFGTYVQVPSWRSTDDIPRPTGSVYVKTTKTGSGASIVVKTYSSASDTWKTLAAPVYGSEQEALFNLDPTAGGNGLSIGTVYVQYDVDMNGTLSYKVFARTLSGATKITGVAPTGTPTFNPVHAIKLKVSQPLQESLDEYTITIGGTTSAQFVAAILAANIPYITAKLETSGAISITHRAGGVIYISNVGGGTALNTAGFNANTSGIRTTMPMTSSSINNATELMLSNFGELMYTISATTPYQAPEDGTLWYYGDPFDVDIMICETTGWKGYRNVGSDARGYNLQATNPTGPILSASEPTLQTDGTSLVPGDLWIDTGDLENYPRIYRRNTASKWIAIDNTDAISQNGIVFADTRWDGDGTTDVITGSLPSITELTTNNYVDLDAPSYQLYPRGTLLFNTRRSGYNIKQYVSNKFTVTNYPNDVLPDVAATWQTASGNKDDGSPYAGSKAQRRMVVKALRAAISASTEIREERFAFSLIAAPGYPELISDMVALNNDRRNTAFVIGDTPLNLPANIVQITNWSAGVSGVYGNGLTTGDPYLGVFYPACVTIDVQGNEIVQPASHMMLRTFIRSDNVSFPWFAPAGTRRGLIDNATSIGYISSTGTSNTFIQTGVNQSLRDAMYPINVNPITVLPGVGLVAFGQKTRNPTASSLDRINVARLVNYIRTILANVGNGFLFEPNDKITRDQIKQIIEGAMNDLVSKRGIYDYLVVCDDSNNTPERVTRNELYVDIAIEPMKDVEFIYVPIRLKNPGDIQAGR
jgi:hypothetical protein